MSYVDKVLNLYKHAAKIGGEVLVIPKPKELRTEYSLGDIVISLGVNHIRKHYECKFGLFEKFYKDKVEHQGEWNGVTTNTQELNQYRSYSHEVIVAAFQKDILEAKGG